MSRSYRDQRFAAWRQVYDRWKWWYDLMRENRLRWMNMMPRDLIREKERAHPGWLWPHSDWNEEYRQENRRERRETKHQLRMMRRR